MWEEWGAYAVRKGNYSISKAMIDGKWIFQLWQLSPEKSLGKFARYKEAQAVHEKILSKEK